MTGNKTTVYIRHVPREVKDHFKAYCAKRGITMADMITKMMREKIQKDSTLDFTRRSTKPTAD